ncbi:hypothetical protein YB2330_004520 [Saitoella coloradoensis]
MPLKSPRPDVHIPDQDIITFLFDRKPACDPNAPLFVNGMTGVGCSWNQLKDLSGRFGAGLVEKLQWKKGDVLAIMTQNAVEYPIVAFGTHIASGIVTPVNPSYTAPELTHQLRNSGARILVIQPSLLSIGIEACKTLNIPRERIYVIAEESVQGFQSWSSIMSKNQLTRAEHIKNPSKDLAYLVYSSGTTGLAKGVMLSHTNLIANMCQLYGAEGKYFTVGKSKYIGVLPFYHIYGLTCLVHLPVLQGIPVIILPQFTLKDFCNIVQKYKITYVYAVPPIILQLAKDPIVDNYDLSSLEMFNCGAAPLTKELTLEATERLRVPIKQGYGMTESSPVSIVQDWNKWRVYGSTGHLLPNMSLKFVSPGPEHEELPVNTEGELWVRGPNVMQGYHGNEDATRETITEDGWLKTGDVGYVDADGNVFITDRVKELIKYKGFQVPPAELEGVIISHPAVKDVAVIGVYDATQATELPRAYVVLKDSVKGKEREMEKDIVAFVRGRVAKHKRLRGGVRFVEEVPKSPSGKILRRKLRDEVKAQGETAGAFQAVAKL